MINLHKISVLLAWMILALSVLPIQAQIPSELQSLVKKFNDAQGFQLEYQVDFYSRYLGGNRIESAKGEIASSGKLQWESVLGIERLYDGQFHLVIDHERNWMRIAKSSQEASQVGLGYQLQQWMSSSKKVEKVPATPGENAWRLDFDEGEYAAIGLVLSERSGLPLRIVLYYRDVLAVVDGGEGERPRMEVNYHRVSLDLPDPEKFSMSRFWTVQGEIVRPTAAYSNYRILN